MRFEIEYTTVYAYPAEVWDNLNTLRVKPTSNVNQRVEGFELRLSPDAPVSERRDYFGTHVLEFGVHDRHTELRIDATCRVATEAEPLPDATGWEELDTTEYRLVGGEFLLQAGTAPSSGRMEGLTNDVKAESPLATALRAAQLIPERFTYKPGVTFVGSTVADLLEAGAGVCQDFAHLALRLLRSHGIAARYVSGYLFAAGDDGDVEGDDSIEVQTHAWLEALVPGTTEPTWIALDPTNSTVADEKHVKIGHGRFYQDVPPIRGVYKGAVSSELDGRVAMRRL